MPLCSLAFSVVPSRKGSEALGLHIVCAQVNQHRAPYIELTLYTSHTVVLVLA